MTDPNAGTDRRYARTTTTGRSAGAPAARSETSSAEDPPGRLEDWPDGPAKYKTLGGGEDESDDAYGEGATANLGPADVVHHEDGSVSVAGEKVDNPEDYKADEPIPNPLSEEDH